MQEEKVSREGLVGTVLFHLLLLIFFCFYILKANPPVLQEQGILINFGSMTQGSGEVQPISESVAVSDQTPSTPNKESSSSAAASEQPKKQAPKPINDNKVATIDDDKGTALPVEERTKKKDTKKEETKKKKENKKKTPKKDTAKDKPKKDKEEDKTKVKKSPVPTKETKPKKDKPKQVEKPKAPTLDPNAIFKGKKSNNSTGQGSTSTNGDLGSKMGDVKISDAGDPSNPSSGTGRDGIGFSLAGRRFLSIPDIQDKSQDVGVIVIRIKVKNDGTVADAQYQSSGSTTTSQALTQKAITAAKKARFNSDSNAAPLQTGSITFTFTFGAK